MIPLSDIDSIRRVCVEVPEKSEKFNELKNFQFEIFLRKEGTMRWSSKMLNRIEQEGEEDEEHSYVSPLKASEI